MYSKILYDDGRNYVKVVIYRVDIISPCTQIKCKKIGMHGWGLNVFNHSYTLNIFR